MHPEHESLRVRLLAARRMLVRSYLLHLGWFAAMCAFTLMHWQQKGLQASVLFTLLTVPPVLYYTVRVHRLCRALDPTARTVGLVPVVVTTLLLSPFESGLILLLKNLLAAKAVLRRRADARTSPSPDGDGDARPDDPDRAQPFPYAPPASQPASPAASNGQSSSRPSASASTGTRAP